MTSDDMQGFWELILLQVNDVNKMFEECRVMEKSNWQPPKSPVSCSPLNHPQVIHLVDIMFLCSLHLCHSLLF